MAPSAPHAEHLRLMAEQRKVMMAAISGATGADAEVLRDMEVVEVMWVDPERTDDTALGGWGCWGDNITDVRLQTRRGKRDPQTGEKIAGTETAWELCQVLQMGSNLKDTRTVIDASQFKLIVADPDGGNKRRKTLKEVSGNLKQYFPNEGLERPAARVDRVAVAHRVSFVPCPKDTQNWWAEVRYVCFGYNTRDASKPKNMLFFSDPMNTSIFMEEPGRFGQEPQPLYTKLTVTDDEGGSKIACHATSVEPTGRSIKDIGRESHADSAAAAAVGKGTQVRTGPVTLEGASSIVWHGAVPIQEPPPPKPVVGTRVYRSFGDEEPHYRSLGGASGEEDQAAFRSCGASGSSAPAAPLDDGTADEDRVAPGAPPRRVDAKEARIGLGGYVEDAKPLTNKSPVAKPRPAMFTSMGLCTIDMGCNPTYESILDGARLIKQRHRQTNELGDEITDRLSEQAAAAGITTQGPVSYEAKLEIQEAVGGKIDTPGVVVPPPKRARGVPVLTGVPADD